MGNVKHIPNKIRKSRRKHGLLQIQLARILGYKNASRVNAWENGVEGLSVENLLKVSIVTHTLVEELLYDYREQLKKELLESEYYRSFIKNQTTHASEDPWQ